MGWIIFSIFILVLIFIGLGFLNKTTETYTKWGETHTRTVYKWGFNKLQWLSLFALLLIIPSFITVVPANSVGILYSPFTGVSEDTLSEGVHIKNPFAKVYKISTEVQTQTLNGIYTQTSDSQYITSVIDIKYAVNSSNVFLIFKQFRTLDNMSSVLISPTVQRVFELITTDYNVIDALGDKRPEIYNRLQTDLANELSKYGITFYSVTIVDTDAGETIERAIEAEAVAKKAVEIAQQELLKAETEAKQKTVTAQAEQDAAKIQAETKIIQAQAEKEANELLSKSLTKEILYKMYIDKWNGKLSTVVSGDGQLIIDPSELIK